MIVQTKISVQELLDYLILGMITAGNYAATIQSQVRNFGKNEGDNIFSQALTHADLSVQNYLEVLSLARFPNVSFQGEEYKRSYNTSYFPTDSEYKILLDPIDGTYFYKEGRDKFSVILSILKDGFFEGSAIYFPRRDHLFYGLKGEGAYRTTAVEYLSGKPAERLKLKSVDAPFLIWQHSESNKGLRSLENLIVMGEELDSDLSLIDILTGGISGFVRWNAQLIDWAAFAFLAEEAGAIVSDIAGKELPAFEAHPAATTPTLLTTLDTELQDQIIKLLASS